MIDDRKEIIQLWEEAARYHNKDAALEAETDLVTEAVRWLADAVGGRERAGELILLALAFSDGFLEWLPCSLKDEIVRYVHEREEVAVT